MKLTKRTMLAATLAGQMISGQVQASSHREAPGIAMDGPADITDIYMFTAGGERANTHVVLVMNVYPGQLADGAPNWYRFADDVRYEFHIDNDGDAKPDVTYRWEFTTAKATGDAAKAPIAYLPGVSFEDGAYTYSLSQSYKFSKITSRSSQQIVPKAPVAPARVGPFTTDYGTPENILNFASPTKTDATAADAAYTQLAANAIVNAGEYRMFAGPRNDPFFVDLGGVFDGLNLRIPGVTGTPRDALKGHNVLSMVVEVPRSDLIRDPANPIFGGWATTSRKQSRFLRAGSGGQIENGGWVQVSRLGNPLVNEVVIGFQDKDKFNATPPHLDVANYAEYVTTPGLAGLINALYGVNGALTKGILGPELAATQGVVNNISPSNRGDLVAAFVTGIPGINRIPGTSTGGDMLRVNLNLPSGWPVSGRTLRDDVVASALQFLAECRFLSGYSNFDLQTLRDANGNPLLPNHLNTPPAEGVVPANCILNDGLSEDDVTEGGTGQTAQFPYIGIPHSSYGVSGT